MKFKLLALAMLVAATGCSTVQNKLGSTALPSWNDTATKSAIVEFVEGVTDNNSPNFIPVAERIATFDNDGTLWSEQPIYFQAIYIFDRIKTLAPEHSEWNEQEPFASVLKDDMAGALAGGEHGLIEMAMATHADLTSEEFGGAIRDWLATAKHPTTGRAYTEMVFQPMLELLDYLRANGFKTYIVSGGGIDFMRVFAEETYGVPPEQVIGSSIKAKYEVRNGKPVIVKIPELEFIDDKEGKPVGIYQHIGRRPVFAAGNSDGDFQMLEWTTSQSGPSLGVLIHHTDAEREWAYDRDSHIGQLARGLDEGEQRGWVIVDMKNDWSAIYPDEE